MHEDSAFNITFFITWSLLGAIFLFLCFENQRKATDLLRGATPHTATWTRVGEVACYESGVASQSCWDPDKDVTWRFAAVARLESATAPREVPVFAGTFKGQGSAMQAHSAIVVGESTTIYQLSGLYMRDYQHCTPAVFEQLQQATRQPGPLSQLIISILMLLSSAGILLAKTFIMIRNTIIKMRYGSL